MLNRKHCLQLLLFKEVNNDETFPFTESCQQKLLYWLLSSNFFFRRVSVFSTSWTVYLNQACCRNLCLVHCPFVFLLKYTSPYTLNFLQSILRGFHFSTTKNLMTSQSSSLDNSDYEYPTKTLFSIRIFFQTMQCLNLGKLSCLKKVSLYLLNSSHITMPKLKKE